LIYKSQMKSYRTRIRQTSHERLTCGGQKPYVCMTYYEELGVAPGANEEQIRQSYRSLARLLHPDTQTDPHLRTLAEGQMRRLGEMVAILCDPATRMAYDFEIGGASALSAPIPWAAVAAHADPPWLEWLKSAGHRWFWILLGAMVAGVTVWSYEVRQPPAVPEAPVDALPSVERPVGKDRPAKSAPYSRQIAAKVLRAAKPPVLPDPPVSESKPAPHDFRLPPLAAEPVHVLPAPAMAVPPAQAEARKPAADATVAGNWFYLPAEGDKVPAGQYPAYYVELVLQAVGGQVSGHYWSRHHVADRAISPEVRLDVAGKSGDQSVAMRWTSADGARGDMELTLRAPDQLDVRWWSTKFGSHSALTSGTATLVRQVIP